MYANYVTTENRSREGKSEESQVDVPFKVDRLLILRHFNVNKTAYEILERKLS